MTERHDRRPDAGRGTGARRRAVQRPLLVLHRARAQAGLLTLVTVLALVGTTALGLCALLLTTARDQALETAVRTTEPSSVQVTAAVSLADDATGADVAAEALSQVSATTTAAFGAFATTTSVWATSTARYLAPMPNGDLRQTYLLEGDDVAQHATLAAGRWPVRGDGVKEVALLDSTAHLLDLAPGSTLVVAATPQHLGEAPTDPLTVLVVGTFTPRLGDQTWTRDPLDAAGYAPRGATLPTYGPLVVPAGTLVGRLPLARFHVVVTPDLRGATTATIDSAGNRLSGLRSALEQQLGARVQGLALTDAYPAELQRMRAELGVTASGVLVAALLVTALGGTALGLAGQLLAGRRAAEAMLLRARGAAQRQLVTQATVEALAVTVLAAGLAVPLSVVAFRALARVPRLAAAGLSGRAGVTAALLAAVAVAGLVLGTLLVVGTVGTGPAGRRRSRRGLVARSGADAVLLALAVLGYLQLRAHGVATGADADPVLVAAPVLCLVGGAVAALRLLPWVARLAEAHAGRSRRLVVPLAAWETARRRHSTAGAFLLVLATAGATFGLTFLATWERSQSDQAEAQVATQVEVDPGGAAAVEEGPALARVTGGVPMAVAQRPVALGSHVGLDASGAATQLLATDVARGFGLARPPAGSTWGRATAGLASVPPAGPLLSGDGAARLEVTGSAKDGTPLVVTPSLVVQDRGGGQDVRNGPEVPLDGAAHEVDVPLGSGPGDPPPAGGVRVVAIRLALGLAEGAEPPSGFDQSTTLAVRVVLRGAAPGPGSGSTPWFGASPTERWQMIRAVQATEQDGTAGATVTTTADVALVGLLYGSGDLMVVAGRPVDAVPVLVSRALADELGVGPGDRLSLTVGQSTLDARVTGVASYVPSVVAARAVLADRTTLGRALLGVQDLDPLTDRWWVDGLSAPTSAASALTSAGLGRPLVRDDVLAQLRDGPLPMAFVAATWTLVAAACLLALSGTAAHVAAAIGTRGVEVARLLGLGMSRAAVGATFLLQHVAVCVVAVGAGAVVGGAVVRLVGPSLVVSTTGGRPVPPALVVWPWWALAAAVGLLVVGSAAAAVPVTLGAVRRAGASHLRMDVEP